MPQPWFRASSPAQSHDSEASNSEPSDIPAGAEQADFTELEANGAIGQSQIIRTLLTPAARAWLRSQLQAATDLQIQLAGRDVQLLRGQIPSVALSGQGIVYRGLHLSKIQVAAEKIRFNIGQVLRGKPFNPLDPICVQVNLTLQEADLNASLAESLLSRAIADLLAQWLTSPALETPATPSPELPGSGQALANLALHDPRFEIAARSLRLTAEISTAQWGRLPIGLETDIQIEAGQKIKLIDPQWLTPAPSSAPWPDLNTFCIDLGDQVQFKSLTLGDRHLHCQGEIWVKPAHSEPGQ